MTLHDENVTTAIDAVKKHLEPFGECVVSVYKIESRPPCNELSVTFWVDGKEYAHAQRLRGKSIADEQAMSFAEWARTVGIREHQPKV